MPTPLQIRTIESMPFAENTYIVWLPPRKEALVIDPGLEPVPDEPSHHVACLLEPDVRRRLWAELGAGHTPEEALAAVGLPSPSRAPAGLPGEHA